MENIIMGIVTGICIILTIVLISGKGEMLVAGYNMLSGEQREKINGKALSRFMGIILLIVTAAVVLTWLEISLLQEGWIIYIVIPLIIVPVLFALVYSWGFKRFLI